MNNPTTVRLDFPPYVLDELEFCVRAYEAYQAQPAGTPELEAQAAYQDYRNKAVNVVSILMVEMRDLQLGTLGEALEVAARNRAARVAAAAASFPALPVTA
ncbi:hypothetical protein D3C76_1576680 [compost metagenome]